MNAGTDHAVPLGAQAEVGIDVTARQLIAAEFLLGKDRLTARDVADQRHGAARERQKVGMRQRGALSPPQKARGSHLQNGGDRLKARARNVLDHTALIALDRLLAGVGGNGNVLQREPQLTAAESQALSYSHTSLPNAVFFFYCNILREKIKSFFNFS